MNGSIEEFNKSFDRLFWQKEIFTDLSDIRHKAEKFFARQNEFYGWQMKKEKKSPEHVTPKRMLKEDFEIDLDHIPLVAGKIYFIRQVDGKGTVSVLNERFFIGKEYVGEYITAIIDTKEHALEIMYRDEDMVVHSIKKFEYKIDEPEVDLDVHIFRPYPSDG